MNIDGRLLEKLTFYCFRSSYLFFFIWLSQFSFYSSTHKIFFLHINKKVLKICVRLPKKEINVVEELFVKVLVRKGKNGVKNKEGKYSSFKFNLKTVIQFETEEELI